MRNIRRRQFLKAALGTVFGAGGLSACSSEKIEKRASGTKQLNIFSWADYIHPDAIPEFEKRYGIKVVYDTFSSNEALMARMEAGNVDYDIIIPTVYAVTKLRRLNLLKEIDHSQVPNLKNISEHFRQKTSDPENQFSVPYTFGTTGIAFNSAALSALGVPFPSDSECFWEKRLKGRMTLLEDPRETLGFAMKRRGFSYNSVDQKQISDARNDLINQKPLTMCYTSDQVITALASGDSRLSLAYSGDARQARRSNKDVRYVIPSTGGSMWSDNMCIPKSAPNEQNALLWINYMLEPQTSAAMTNFTFYPTPNFAARQFVKPELLADTSMYPSDATLDRCEEIRDIGDGIFLFDRAWTELKCV